CEFVDITDLQLYNEDIDQDNPPASYSSYREKLSSFDAFLFFTPEYNRSMPAVLKNALDVGSRPYGKSKWDGKPAGIISVSPGAIRGFAANHLIRLCLSFLNIHPYQPPYLYIGHVPPTFNDKGTATFEQSIKSSKN